MKKKEVDSAIYDGLAKILVPAGFKGRKSDGRFVRPTSFGFQEVGFSLADYNPMFAFSVYFALRFDAIQNEANPLYPNDPENWADSLSVLLKPDHFIKNYRRFEVETLDEIRESMTDIGALFRDHIFPFFDSCTDLAAVERLLNREPDGLRTSNRLGHAITGVVAAALCQRSDFFEIVARYRDMLGGSMESIREQFEAAVIHATANILKH